MSFLVSRESRSPFWSPDHGRDTGKWVWTRRREIHVMAQDSLNVFLLAQLAYFSISLFTRVSLFVSPELLIYIVALCSRVVASGGVEVDYKPVSDFNPNFLVFGIEIFLICSKFGRFNGEITRFLSFIHSNFLPQNNIVFCFPLQKLLFVMIFGRTNAEFLLNTTEIFSALWHPLCFCIMLNFCKPCLSASQNYGLSNIRIQR